MLLIKIPFQRLNLIIQMQIITVVEVGVCKFDKQEQYVIIVFLLLMYTLWNLFYNYMRMHHCMYVLAYLSDCCSSGWPAFCGKL